MKTQDFFFQKKTLNKFEKITIKCSQKLLNFFLKLNLSDVNRGNGARE